ncbi:MAG: isochorismate synthase [Bacteroidales bacterium]|jgi:isochorismate synthase|nr:isochorismate synthase [Bacteroidales bacterium]
MIDTLIRQGDIFAAYRIPDENTAHLLIQNDHSPLILQDVSQLNGQQGYVMAPYHVTDEHPLVIIRPDRDAILPVTDERTNGRTDERANERTGKPTTEYEHCFSLFIQSLQEKRLDKLVLSRQMNVERHSDFSPEQAFFTACRRYKHSYVYLCHTPVTGTWLGSSPEILLSGSGNQWHTVALAGTQPLSNGELPAAWDDKNKEEQHLVAMYVKQQLTAHGIRFSEEPPHAVRAGELAHLRSDFHFSLPDANHLGNLLKRLHPTPAVCGLPKEKAYRFTLNEEGYDRRYYSGFTGRLHPTGNTDLYVNLRCMHIGQQLTLYAGGGLLPSSSLNEEWKETEDKLQTMLKLI